MAAQSQATEGINFKVGIIEDSSGVSRVASSVSSTSTIHTEDENGRRHSVSATRKHAKIDHFRGRYPHCIVWTPITVITWFIPILGHVGIAYTNGKIRDFSDAFVVADDRMTHGRPAKYLEMDTKLAMDQDDGWDEAIEIASEEYTVRDHDTCCDNSYSMVALALNLMRYKNSQSWNMFWVFLYILIYSKYVGCWGFWKTWGPFILLVVIGGCISLPFVFGNSNTFSARTSHNASDHDANQTSPTGGRFVGRSGSIELEI